MPIKTEKKKNGVNKLEQKTKKKGGVMSNKSNSSSPKNQIVEKKRSPVNISTIVEDLQIKILDSVFNFSNILDNKVIKDYIQLKSNVTKVNKSFKTSSSFIRPSFNNITIIKLNKLRIDNEILGVLKMTKTENIESIELRNISFESIDTCNEFIDFFRKNRKVKNVILDKVEVKIEDFLRILITFKRLENLEISGYELTYNEFHIFIKVLLYSKQIKYFTFKNNIIDKRYYTYLFTKDVDNDVVYIDNVKYIIYISKEYNNRWGMIIKKMDGSFVKNIEVNIVGNEVENEYIVYRNFLNDFKDNK
jgi:hypothetical protein